MWRSALAISVIGVGTTGTIAHPATAATRDEPITLLSQSSYVSGVEGSFFQMSVQLSNDLLGSIDASTRLVLSSHRPVTSRSDVRRAIDGDLPQIIDSISFPIVESAGRIDLNIPTEITTLTNEALQMSATGIYPLSIEVTNSDDTAAQLVSFIERLDTDGSVPTATSPVHLSIVGRLEAPLSTMPTSDSAVADSTRQLLADWVSVLERRPDLSLAAAIQPELVDAFSRSTPEDQELLIRLQRAISFDIMSTTYVVMDPTDADRHGLRDTFTRQLRLGDTTLGSLFPERVTPRRTWLQSSPLSSGGARVLADLGFRSVIMTRNSRLTADGEDIDDFGVDVTRSHELEFSDGGIIASFLTDAAVSTDLDRGSADPQGGEHLVAHQVLADLRVMRAQATETDPMSTLLLSTSSGALPSPGLIDALFDVVGRDPRFVFGDLDTALVRLGSTGEPEVIELADRTDDPSRFPASATLASLLQSLESTIDAYASALPRSDERVRAWRQIYDVIPDDRLDNEQRQPYVEAIRVSTQEIASSVVPPASTTFTLGGRSSPIRFTIRNDGPTDLEVLVRLSSSKLRLSEGSKIVSLPADTSTTVEFDVNARTNGRFPVTLQLLTPSGEVLLSPPSTLTARVNALAGLGQLVTGIALLFLATWWASHFRREYRRRRAETDLSARRHPSGEGSG